MVQSSITLLALQQIIKERLKHSLDSRYWVVAELSQMSIASAGHCYMELIERSEDSKYTKAKSSAVIWKYSLSDILRRFSSATCSELKVGMKVMLLVEVSYHELYGFSLVVHDIDPTYTLGESEMLRRATIEKLAAAGDLERNSSLEFPLLPQRIAVVSSKSAAGYGDFMDELEKNEFGYQFAVDFFHTTMQGAEADGSIVASLDAIYSVASEYDCIVIIRGGGSSSDLSCFDSYNIAHKVSLSPITVITGIGHDRDKSITDMTAAVSVKTPTAVARFLIDRFCEIDNELTDKREYVKQLFDEQCDMLRDEIVSSSHALRQVVNTMVKSGEIYFGLKEQKLKGSVTKYFTDANGSLTKREADFKSISISAIYKNQTFVASLYNMIKSKSLYLLSNSKKNITLLESQTDSFNPSHIFALGYSFAKIEGKILRSADQVKVGNVLNVRLTDADIEANVTHIIKR